MLNHDIPSGKTADWQIGLQWDHNIHFRDFFFKRPGIDKN